MSCKHPNFTANVEVGRIASDDENLEHDEISFFVADVRVECSVCHQRFGFRVPDVGVLGDRPTVSVDALELRVPLISPAELELLGPLAAMRAHDGSTGFGVRFSEPD